MSGPGDFIKLEAEEHYLLSRVPGIVYEPL